MYDRDYHADISPEQVTPAMMGHFNRSERQIIRFVKGLDGRTITNDDELQFELDFQRLHQVTSYRRTAFSKLRELMSAMEIARASPGQVRLSAELSSGYGVTVAPAELTTELLEQCFRGQAAELAVLDRLYIGSSGEPTVQSIELTQEQGAGTRRLKISALKRLVRHLSQNKPGLAQEGENNHRSTDDNLTGPSSKEEENPPTADLSMATLRMLVIEPQIRIRRLEELVRDLTEKVDQLRADLIAHLQSMDGPNEAI